MNKIFSKHLKNYNDKIPSTLLLHQIETLDFLIRKCIYDKKSVLLYHKMGSGKTILSLSFALLVSNITKILIIVPNFSISEIWESQLKRTLSILPSDIYNLDNIQIKTRTKFVDEINALEQSLINKVKLYENYIIIIDEAHNFFGNNSGDNIIKIRQNLNSIFILLTGSPITNTAKTLKDLLIILKKKINFNNKYIDKGNKVIEIKLTSEGKNFIQKELYGLVSYYNQEIINIPEYYYYGKKIINYPIVLCEMSDLQTEYYNNIRKLIKDNSEMFSKILLNASFCILGDYDNYINFKNIIGTNKTLLPGLNINGDILNGDQLIKLDISCKLKYFRDNYINIITNDKKFIYFSNSTLGSIILRSMLRANGISEYGKDIVNNFRCTVCNTKYTCEICKPAKYSIITAKELVNNPNIINVIINKYNEDLNDNGDNIMFLFGSKIISESYTLKEVKHIIFLTIPETKSELTQITARALRSFSYKNINNTKVYIKILCSYNNNYSISELFLHNQKKDLLYSDKNITNTTNEDIVKKYMNKIEEDYLSFDIKKMLYLEIKSERSNSILKILKKSHINYTDKPVKELEILIFNEILKRYFYNYKYINNKILIDITKNIINENNILKLLELAINKGFIIYNKDFKNSFIKYLNKNIYHIIPFKIKQSDYLMSLDLNEFKI